MSSPSGQGIAEKAGPLRSRLLRLLAAGECDAPEIGAFLDEENVAAGLFRWLGDGAGSLSRAQLRAQVDRDIAEIDAHISRLLAEIQDDESLRGLEARWRGLKWLVRPVQGRMRGATVRVRILDLTKRELARDLSKNPDFDQTLLFQKIHEEGFGIAGGKPFGLLVCDYEISHKPLEAGIDDIAMLRELSKVAAASFCPVALAAAPSLFGVDSVRDLARRENIRPTFEQEEYRRFRAFQSTDESRFVALTVGRLLAARPVSSRMAGDLGFVHGLQARPTINREIWFSAAFGLAHVVIRSFAQHSWPAAMRGAPDRPDRSEIAGGVINPPDLAYFETDRPGALPKIFLEAALSERQEAQLNALGFIAPRACSYTEYSAFFSVPTLRRAQEFRDASQAQSERMSALLNYLLCVCRFAHYVKVIARDWAGSYLTATECQQRLQAWIGKYCIVSDGAGYAERARFPLRRARITVNEAPGKPGSFDCRMTLQPHFQLDYVVSEFELTTEISAAKQAA